MHPSSAPSVQLSGQGPSAAIVVDVLVDGADGVPQGWTQGPLPILQASNETTVSRGHHVATDERARRTLVGAAQGDALYGGAGTARAHWLGSSTASDLVVALEVIQVDRSADDPASARGWLVVHAEMPQPDFLDTLADSVHGGPAKGVWPGVIDLLPDGLRIPDGAKVRSVSFQTADQAADDSVVRELSYVAAAAVPSGRAPDMTARAAAREMTVIRHDWSALILRDGGAFVAHQRSDEQFAATLQVLVHSIHVDALLLALLQRRMVDDSGARTATASLDTPDELVELERGHFEFKRTYWRTSLTDKRSSPSDEILRAFQEELLTARDVIEVEERVEDGARLAKSLQAELHAAAQARLERLVQTASVVIGAFGLSFTAAPVIRDPSVRLFVIASIVGVVAMALAFLALRVSGRRS